MHKGNIAEDHINYQFNAGTMFIVHFILLHLLHKESLRVLT